VAAAGAGPLWTPQVQRIDPATGGVVASVPVSGVGAQGVPGASQVVFWNGSVWALSMQRSLSVLRIDPGTDRVAGQPMLVGHPFPAALAWTSNPTAFVAGPTGLWVLDFDRNLLFHLATRSAGS
jgi:DNA-binding beta-propeller fold protein YncE